MTLWKLPPISEGLIKALDQRFPERCPELDWEDRKVWFYTGQREVVRFLISEHERQNKTILSED